MKSFACFSGWFLTCDVLSLVIFPAKGCAADVHKGYILN